MRRHQQGMTLTSFVVVLAVVGVFIYMAMKLIPMYSEFFAVKKALEGMAREPEIASYEPGRIKDLFFRRMEADYVDDIKPENIKIARKEAGWVMTVEYEVRKPLIANLDVVGHFNAEKEFKRTMD